MFPFEATMNANQKGQFSIKPAYAFGAANGLEKEIDGIREMVVEWDLSYNTSLRKGYLLELFENRGILDKFISENWPPGGEYERQRVLRIIERYEAFLSGTAPAIPLEEEVEEHFFPLEAHLRDFIAANIGNLKLLGQKLRLYSDDLGRNGIEYPTDVGPIDVLAVDADGGFVVFELKLSKGPDRTVGQVLRYMGWVTKHLAAGKRVTGVIVAHEVDEKLKYAVSVVPNIVVFEYKVQFELPGR